MIPRHDIFEPICKADNEYNNQSIHSGEIPSVCDSDFSYICQLDGNVSQCNEPQSHDSNEGWQIPVHISQHRTSARLNSEARVPVRKTLRRNNVVLQAMELPVVLNINPRSIYNKTEDFKLLVEQYEGDVICISGQSTPEPVTTNR